MKSLTRIWLEGVIVAGTLDLLSAFVFSGMKGASPMSVLQFVASGPLGDRALQDPSFAIAGVLVHYGIMACMVAFYLFAAQRLPVLNSKPLLSGILYGFALWGLMYWVVRPLRWPDLPMPTAGGVVGVAKQLFSHLILVGIPIAWITARGLRSRR